MTARLVTAESASEHLRNARQLCAHYTALSEQQAEELLGAIDARVRKALEALSEPSPSMVVAMRKVIESHSPLMAGNETEADMNRYYRDCASIVLRALVNGWTP